ncbi:MAG: FecR domain-containing protein [Bacteroidota bacterium]
MEHVYWELIAKALTGELSAEEEQQFAEWIKAHPDNETLYKQVQKVWTVSEQIGKDYSPDTSMAWEKLKARIESGKAKTNVITSYRRNWLTLAAAILAIAVFGFVVKQLFFSDPERPGKLQYVEISTADSVNIFYLPDSSKIFLNRNSGIVYADGFQDTARIAYLTGEAYFEVREDDKTFVVFAGGTQVTVLGTSFNVKANEEDEEVEITVIEGEVAFKEQGMSNDSTLVIETNEQVTFNRTSKKRKKGKNTNANLWWGKADLEKSVKRVINKVKRKIK